VKILTLTFDKLNINLGKTYAKLWIFPKIFWKSGPSSKPTYQYTNSPVNRCHRFAQHDCDHYQHYNTGQL